jgi:tetratricopeptide (TPR) repeat protein
MGRLPECLEELKEAIRLDPKDEIALLDIESISRRLGRKEESMIILSSITPSREVRGREAVNLLEAKRYDEILSRFSSPGPTDSLVTRMAVATSLMAKVRYRDAYRVLKEILLEHPTYPEALNNMGVCMRFMGEYAYDEPMHFMRLAVEADPNYGDAWNNIGATLFVLGEYDAAMEAIRKAISVDRRSDYLINLSKCQIMVGDIAGFCPRAHRGKGGGNEVGPEALRQRDRARSELQGRDIQPAKGKALPEVYSEVRAIPFFYQWIQVECCISENEE